jgi:hypothetical protein
VDDLNTRGSGTRRDDDPVADADRSGSDQDYFWESKPGEDFGPLPPPSPDPPPNRRRPSVIADDAPSTSPDSPTRRAPAAAPRRLSKGDAYRFDGRDEPPRPNRGRRALLVVVGILVVLVGIVGAALVVVSRQAAGVTTAPATSNTDPNLDALRTRDTLSTATLSTPVAPLLTSTPLPSPAASPTPLILTQVTPAVSPVAARTPGAQASPAARTSPVIAPTFPSSIAPPSGSRFPTSTPARLGTPSTPAPTRTAPPVPTARPVSFLARVWSEPTMAAAVGDQVSICGSASAGASAEIIVIAPDRSTTTLGSFQPPTERVCQPFRPAAQGLYVLTLIVKDANGVETDRQAGTLWIGR